MLGNSFSSDELGSDAMEQVLEMSLAEYRSTQERANALAGPSSVPIEQPSYLQKHNLNARLSSIEAEIKGVDDNIEQLRTLRESLLMERKEILDELQRSQVARVSTIESKVKGKAKQQGAIDYTAEFDWTSALKDKMKKIFGIANFRLCQEGVCNANMDGRDIVCVMPTGGGKSLTYQLPALLVPGCTLVISPLISLITDQILHLQDAGVEAVMLTSSASKEAVRVIYQRLSTMASDRDNFGPDIKLCYVTPEKIAKSKGFVSLLEKLNKASKLARIVIDEAHCVSQLGHDFRPDYKKLSTLRQLFPRVPILALSATCPPTVLKDLLHVLQLKPVVNGTSAGNQGTVYFSAPLYRKNLHYAVVPKPSGHADTIRMMKDYIMEHHADHTGIIYCLSKKDAETVATQLFDASEQKIKTGVYHADIGDRQKEELHKRWRKGQVKVVCATIAFGLGIDKGDVRFVLHHSLSKSLDGFYQESGRAGRDGQDADCILFYRSQDATRLSQLTCGEVGAQEKLHDMLRFVHDMEQCRKIQFANYFSTSSHLSISSWTTQDKDALADCGHCDNCTRTQDSFVRKDVSVAAWQLLRVADAVHHKDGRVTIGQLVDLARGGSGGTFGVGGGKKGRGRIKEKIDLGLEEVAGGKVDLSKEDTESLCVYLLLNHYLKESFVQTAYSINVYVIPGPSAMRLTRLTREDVEQGKGPMLQCCFPIKAARKATSTKKPSHEGTGLEGRGRGNGNTSKRKKPVVLNAPEDIDDNNTSYGETLAAIVDDHSTFEDDDVSKEDEDEDLDHEWNFSLRETVPAKRKPRTTGTRIKRPRHAPEASDGSFTGDQEVISISSD